MDPPTALVDERLQGRWPGWWSSGASFGSDRAGQLRRAEPLLLALDGSVLAAELTVDGDLDLLGAVDLDLLLDRLQDPIGLRLGDRRAVDPPDDRELHAAREPHEDPAALDEVGQIVAGHEDDGKVAGRANREVVANRLPGHWQRGRWPPRPASRRRRHRRDLWPVRWRRRCSNKPNQREGDGERAEDGGLPGAREGLGEALALRRGWNVDEGGA